MIKLGCKHCGQLLQVKWDGPNGKCVQCSEPIRGPEDTKPLIESGPPPTPESSEHEEGVVAILAQKIENETARLRRWTLTGLWLGLAVGTLVFVLVVPTTEELNGIMFGALIGTAAGASFGVLALSAPGDGVLVVWSDSPAGLLIGVLVLGMQLFPRLFNESRPFLAPVLVCVILGVLIASGIVGGTILVLQMASAALASAAIGGLSGRTIAKTLL